MKIGLTTFARLGSERIKDKMLLDFDGCSLIEFQLLKMRKAAEIAGVSPSICLWSGFTELVDIARKVGVQTIYMSEQSSRGETLETIYDQIIVNKMRHLYDMIISVNICCPFLLIEDMLEWIEIARRGQSVAPVFILRDNLYNSDLKRIDGNTGITNTKTDNIFYSSCHTYYIYTADDFGTENMCDGVPVITQRLPRYLLDLDDVSDVEVIYSAWNGGFENMRNIVRNLRSEVTRVDSISRQRTYC